MGVWFPPPARGPVRGRVSVPGSKSLTARALVLAALASGPSRLVGALDSRDTRLMASALEVLGARCEWSADGEAVEVTPAPLRAGQRGEPAGSAGPSLALPRLATLSPAAAPAAGSSPGSPASSPSYSSVAPLEISCGLSGTVLRFVAPLAALAARPVRFTGDEQALSRPMKPLLAALSALGARVTYHGREGFLPFTICGPLSYAPGSRLVVDASASSQFLSALLLAAPAFPAPLVIEAAGAFPSLPHVIMTEQEVSAAGGRIERVGPRAWKVEPGPLAGGEKRIEPDLTNAGPFLAAAMLTGGRVTVEGWPALTSQAGDAWIELLTRLGGRCSLDEGGFTVVGPRYLAALDDDFSQVGELVPTLAGLLAFAGDASHLRGISHLRGHETDRLAALERELRRIGCAASSHDDGLRIYPAPQSVAPRLGFARTPGSQGSYRPALWHTYHDHRLVMLGAQMGLRVGGLAVENPGTVRKTFPTFVQVWERLVKGAGNG